MKRLILWTNLLALAACARAIPPAPDGISPVSAIPGVRVPYLERAAPREIAADSSVNDLADAQPDAAGVPEFLPTMSDGTSMSGASPIIRASSTT